mmetsp:Transcript_82613/g.229215  ORF Transcript_82613/g.229215 Transcript_82613/m.229215 type:complete len:251 (-) Transcript_82613:523-1275(-)
MSTAAAGVGLGLSARCSPPKTTMVCACRTPASSKLWTLSTGPTRKTVLTDSNVSTTLAGGGTAESMMTGWWLGRKGCRRVLRKATTWGQTEPPATTNVMRQGSERSCCASFESRKRRSINSSFSSSPKLEFSLRSLRILRWEAVDFSVWDLVSLRGARARLEHSSGSASCCFRLLNPMTRLGPPLNPLEPPCNPSSRRCRNSMRQSTERSANGMHACLLQAMEMTTCPLTKYPSKFNAKRPACCTAIMST